MVKNGVPNEGSSPHIVHHPDRLSEQPSKGLGYGSLEEIYLLGHNIHAQENSRKLQQAPKLVLRPSDDKREVESQGSGFPCPY
jgi:hypothetical protein